MNGFHRAALACALGPLAFGVAIFGGWLFTNARVFEQAGLVVVLGGLVLLVLGLVLLIAAVKADVKAGRPTLKPTLSVVALLLVNLPLSASLSVFALSRMSSHEVTVVNEASVPMGGFVFTDPAKGEHLFPNVPAHERRGDRLTFEGEGQVTWQAFIGGDLRAGLLLGYVSGNGGRVTLVLHPDGGVTTSEE